MIDSHFSLWSICLHHAVLVIIFQYSGDLPDVLRTFLALKQRFNTILNHFYQSVVFPQQESVTIDIPYRAKVQSDLLAVKTIREKSTSDEISHVDQELQSAFQGLRENPLTSASILHICPLASSKGARLQGNGHESELFNFAEALNQLFLCHLNNMHSISRPRIHAICQMFKALIVSNNSLLTHRITLHRKSIWIWNVIKLWFV